MVASSPIPCAIIGTDGYAYQLIKRILLLPEELQIVAACSLDTTGEGARLCRSCDAVLVNDISDLFNFIPREKSVIFNPTPISLHFETSRLCLDQGFHIALEKPPVPTVRELDELVKIGDIRAREISVGFNYLYSNVCRKLRDLLRRGRIGKVRRMRALTTWSRPVGYYGGSVSRGRLEQNGKPLFDGALGNPLSHVLSVMLSLASTGTDEMASPRTVQAELYRGRDYVTSDDTASVRVMTDSGVELVLNLTVAASAEIDPIIEIDGESGRVQINHFEHCEIFPDGESPFLLQGERESRLMMLSEIARARQKSRPPLITLGKCRPFTQTVNAAYESAGGVVPIPAQFRRTFVQDGETFHYIHGIERELQLAHAQGRLLSEGNCPWACRSSTFSTVGYGGFSGLAGSAMALHSHQRIAALRASLDGREPDFPAIL